MVGRVPRVLDRVAPPAATAAPVNDPLGCYRFSRPMGHSAAGNLEKTDVRWWTVELQPEGRDWQPHLTSAQQRMGWDSNPRYAFTYTHFPGVRLKPLGHPSNRMLRTACCALRANYSESPLARRTQREARSISVTDRERFELSIPLPVCRFSRPVPSTTRPPVQQSLRI